MAAEIYLILFLIVVIVLLTNVAIKYKSLYKEERSKKASVVVKHGKTMEHLIPWIKEFPGDPRKFRFIGDPIDGILFGEDEVTFLEFKTGNSQLNNSQRKIKNLIKEKKVKWKEIRISL